MSAGGVYRIARGTGPLRDRAIAAGWDWHEVDLRTARDRDGVLTAFARDLALPSWFGANWDALADALGDLGGDAARGVAIHIAGADDLAAADPRAWATACDILEEAASERAAHGAALVVLVRGPAGRGRAPFEDAVLPS